jgi:hypothetical protein
MIIGGSVYSKLFHQAKMSVDVPPNADPYWLENFVELDAYRNCIAQAARF